MSKSLLLEIPDHTFELLATAANQYGQTPERFISELIENNFKPVEDPLLQLAGVFEAPVTNIAEFHDRYIGESLSPHDE